MARAPRTDPTAMKTVPSGRCDCFMKGAFAVGGTDGLGMEEPVRVGRAVGCATEVAPVFEMVILGTEMELGEAELLIETPEVELDLGGWVVVVVEEESGEVVDEVCLAFCVDEVCLAFCVVVVVCAADDELL